MALYTYAEKRILGSLYVMSGRELLRRRTAQPPILNIGALSVVSGTFIPIVIKQYVKLKGTEDLHQANCKEQTNSDLPLCLHL